ncbi:MAG: hypothetical protein M3O35_01230 [Acidobacteriota bacterium]|nr:hypothetical protein [Acidobacteriota bacterium]
MLERHPNGELQVFVIWEPVLVTDWGRPSDGALGLIQDRRVKQFWDRGRVLSHALGEKDKHSIVWDWAGIYPAGTDWRKSAFSAGPVAPKAAEIEAALVGQAFSPAIPHDAAAPR